MKHRKYKQKTFPSLLWALEIKGNIRRSVGDMGISVGMIMKSTRYVFYDDDKKNG